jgi:hypothetical protein
MPDEGTPPEGGTYTPPESQDALNKIVEQRLARERSKYADYDDVKAKAARLDEIEAASKSELEKAQQALAERDEQLQKLPAEARRQAIKFASTASQLGFLDPEDALVFIGDVDLSDSAAVKTALTELAERKPHLVAEAGKRIPSRPKPKSGSAADGTDLSSEPKGKERAAKALREFRNQ